MIVSRQVEMIEGERSDAEDLNEFSVDWRGAWEQGSSKEGEN